MEHGDWTGRKDEETGQGDGARRWVEVEMGLGVDGKTRGMGKRGRWGQRGRWGRQDDAEYGTSRGGRVNSGLFLD